MSSLPVGASPSFLQRVEGAYRECVKKGRGVDNISLYRTMSDLFSSSTPSSGGVISSKIRQHSVLDLKSKKISGELPSLHQAALKGDATRVKALLWNGENPRCLDCKQDGYYKSPIYYAVRSGNIEVVKLLLKAAPISVSHNGESTSFRILGELVNHSNPSSDLLRLLFEYGATSVKRSRIPYVSFLFSCQNNLPLFERLVELGAVEEMLRSLSSEIEVRQFLDELLKINPNIESYLINAGLLISENASTTESDRSSSNSRGDSPALDSIEEKVS